MQTRRDASLDFTPSCLSPSHHFFVVCVLPPLLEKIISEAHPRAIVLVAFSPPCFVWFRFLFHPIIFDVS